MAYQANERYSVVVKEVGLAEASKAGTPGVWFRFHSDANGDIDHTMYIAQQVDSLRIAEESLAALGTPMAHLKDPGWWKAIRAGQHLVGRECEIVTGEEEYEGKKRIRVKFINAKRKEAREGTEDYLAKLFGGTTGGGSAPRSQANSAPPEFPDAPPSDADAPPARRAGNFY